MLVLFQCVAEAVMAKGVRGLADMVPGGNYLLDVAQEALRRLKERRQANQLKDEVLRAATATFEEIKQAAQEAAKEATKEGAPPGPAASPTPIEDRIALELYLTQIPGAVRQSLKRAEDPSGRSVPANFILNEPADLLKRLPEWGVSVVAGVEHVMQVVMKVAQRVIVLDRGAIIAEGPPQEVVHRDEVIEASTIWSVAGLLPRHGERLSRRPFRAPHHTISVSGLIGGGSPPHSGVTTPRGPGISDLEGLRYG